MKCTWKGWMLRLLIKQSSGCTRFYKNAWDTKGCLCTFSFLVQSLKIPYKMRNVNIVLYYAFLFHLVQSEDGLIKAATRSSFYVPYIKNMLCWTHTSWLIKNVRVILFKFLFVQHNMVFWATILCCTLRVYTRIRITVQAVATIYLKLLVTSYPTTISSSLLKPPFLTWP